MTTPAAGHERLTATVDAVCRDEAPTAGGVKLGHHAALGTQGDAVTRILDIATGHDPAVVDRGGLRLAVIGYERTVTAEAGYRVGLSAGAKVVHVASGPLDTVALAALAEARPDIVLPVGGTDGGNPEVLPHNGISLDASTLPPHLPVVVARNPDGRTRAGRVPADESRQRKIARGYFGPMAALFFHEQREYQTNHWTEKIFDVRGNDTTQGSTRLNVFNLLIESRQNNGHLRIALGEGINHLAVAEKRIDGHGHGAGFPDSKLADDDVGRIGHDQGDAISFTDALIRQSRRQRVTCAVCFAKGNVPRFEDHHGGSGPLPFRFSHVVDKSLVGIGCK